MAEQPSMAGWRETVRFPDWGIEGIVAKLDTGARSSCIDARDLDIDPDAPDRVKFWFESPAGRRDQEAEIIAWRLVRDSGGHQELRPVIALKICLGDVCWMDEVTLHDRSTLRHRALLGRRVLAGRFQVDPTATFQLTSSAKPA